MVPKTGSKLPKSHIVISKHEFACAISDALISELGGSHRAAKTVMAWTNVSERTARSWLNANTGPSGVNLVILSAHCGSVLKTMVKLAGYSDVALAFDLKAVERTMETSLKSVRDLIENGS